MQAPNPPDLPQGFLTPAEFHEGQMRAFKSKSRITLVPAGQGGGKTSCWYWRLYAIMQAFPGDSHFVAFPTYSLLNRVVINPVDPNRPTLVRFLETMGEEPVLHKQDNFVECKSGQILFATSENTVVMEGSHARSATIDEFDECKAELFLKCLERTRWLSQHGGSYVSLFGTPRNVRWVRQLLFHRDESNLWVPNDDVSVIQFSSTDNPTYSEEAVKEAMRFMPPYMVDRMHHGIMSDAMGGDLFKREYWEFRTDVPTEFEQIVQFWDTAHKAKESHDYSVCQTWGKLRGELWLLDNFRKRMEWPELVRTAERLYHQWQPSSVRIEDKSSGTPLIQEFHSKGIPAVAINPGRMDKWNRAQSVVGMVEANLVIIPAGVPWAGEFIEELAQFGPDQKENEHDDQVDCTVYALSYFKTGVLAGGRPRIVGEHKVSDWGSGRQKERRVSGLIEPSGGSKIISGGKKSLWR